MIEVIDDFLPEEQHEMIYDQLTSPDFPWFWSTVHSAEETKQHLKNFQMCHRFYYEHAPQSEYGKMINPICEKLDGVFWFRIKANITFHTDNEPYVHEWHTDWPAEVKGICKLKTAVFYVNDNDGYTIFEDGQKVQSKANRIVIFDGELKHAGSTCTNQPNRIVINFNYITSPEQDNTSNL